MCFALVGVIFRNKNLICLGSMDSVAQIWPTSSAGSLDLICTQLKGKPGAEKEIHTVIPNPLTTVGMVF